MDGVVALVLTDLMMEARIGDAVRRLGLEPRVTATTTALREALAEAVLAIVDLQAHGIGSIEAIREASAAGTPVVAYGQHTDAALLRQARDAGAIAVPRSAFFERLPELVASAMSSRAASR